MRKFFLVYLLLLSSTACALDPLVSVDVVVEDETGTSVEGVKVTGTFLDVTDFDTDEEFTDKDGVAVVRGRSLFPVGLVAEKDGFYASAAEVNTVEVVDGEQVYKDQKVRMVLREKRNPVPLYAKRYTGEIPVAKEWVGFDFKVGDWAVPHGKGERTDVLFKYKGYANSFWDAEGELHMKFPNSYAGLLDISDKVDVTSQLIVPHKAPFEGYSNDERWWRLSMSDSVDETHKPSQWKHYYLRLRTITDKDGKLMEANYAKINGDFRFFLKARGSGVAGIAFDYYFNPIVNDRNLEFDTHKNLFKNLTHDERVSKP